ncbi:MAG: 16S rRNA (cytidine(1402)-2'-O)-methyltransferase [Bryobacteraceae bacterium]|nr:16S rRNA (cytidine(1402)-2'-O)-methyltransferase [Bryobacteraceae bacterium]
MAGVLFLVATPIGNLEDITARAARILREVDLIACEDTRHTQKLLNELGIKKPTVSYHEHNEAERAAALTEKLAAGADIALVSDAGTPLISDPGRRLVTLAIEQGIRVIPIPGPSAVLTALAASGLETDSFYFAGFLPSKAGPRMRTLEGLKALDCTLVFYEAPHRILETLADLDRAFGERQMATARELTKVHEEFLRGTAAAIREELASRSSVKGEFTIVVGRPEKPAARPADPLAIRAEIEARTRAGASRMDAIKAVAREFGLPKREAYRIAEENETPRN